MQSSKPFPYKKKKPLKMGKHIKFFHPLFTDTLDVFPKEKETCAQRLGAKAHHYMSPIVLVCVSASKIYEKHLTLNVKKNETP